MTLAFQKRLLMVLVNSCNSSFFKRYSTINAAIMPRIPEINPCRKIPIVRVVPKIGERIFKLKYDTSPRKNEAPRLWKKVFIRKDSPCIKSFWTKYQCKIKFKIVPMEYR